MIWPTDKEAMDIWGVTAAALAVIGLIAGVVYMAIHATQAFIDTMIYFGVLTGIVVVWIGWPVVIVNIRVKWKLRAASNKC